MEVSKGFSGGIVQKKSWGCSVLESMQENYFDGGYVQLLERVNFVVFPIVVCNDDNGAVGVSLLDDFGQFNDLWYGVDVGNVSVAMARPLSVENRI